MFYLILVLLEYFKLWCRTDGNVLCFEDGWAPLVLGLCINLVCLIAFTRIREIIEFLDKKQVMLGCYKIL